MRELDQIESRLKAQQQEVAQGLEHVIALRKILPGALTPVTPAAPKTNGHGKKNGKKAGPQMTAAQRKKQAAASREYWRKVRSGEIKREGYTPKGV